MVVRPTASRTTINSSTFSMFADDGAGLGDVDFQQAMDDVRATAEVCDAFV